MVRAVGFVPCALAAVAAAADCRPSPDRCAAVFAARDWRKVEFACDASRWPDHAEIGRMWRAVPAVQPAETLAVLGRVIGTDLAAEALCLAGEVHARSNKNRTLSEPYARVLLLQAIAAFQAQDNQRGISRAAVALGHVPRPGARHEDALQSAELALSAAKRSGDARALGKAATALAEAYDDVDMAEDARDLYMLAEERLQPWPDDLAYAHLKHGMFLLDIDLVETAILHFDRAEQVATSHTTLFSVHLNRAAALARRGAFDAAMRDLDIAHDDGERSSLELVRGYVEARRGNLAAAEAHFAAASDAIADDEYGWRAAYEIGELHHHAGRLDAAERAYRDATRAVERVRMDAGGVELRLRVLARRAGPFQALLRLYAQQGRGLDALMMAESMHPRTWLDNVLGTTRRDERTADDVIVGARASAHIAGPALDRDALRALIADREALVFVSDGGITWRAHVRGGDVTFAPLSPDAVATATAFRASVDDAELAERAASALLPAELTAGDRPLYLVADGELAGLPFAALRRAGRFLIEDRPLAHLPGLTSLACRPGSWTDRQIFVGDAHGDLPAAAAEVRRLAPRSAHTGDAATSAVVRSARDAAVLHVAVHGKLTPGGGALDLADGRLTAASIVALRIAPRLVVLTGCATATTSDAEAWAGFPSAFLAAGSRHVIATLRSVDDTEAATLAEHFYRAPANLDPIRRLAAAQRAMAAAGNRPHVWASFTAWGVADCPGMLDG